VTKVLIFGKNGQVASCLAETRPPEYSVTFLGHDACDFSAKPDFAAIIKSDSPDLIINAAAYTAVENAEVETDLAHEINATAPAALGTACREAGLPVVHFSTDYVFDGDLGRPYREDDPVSPSGQYGSSKLEGEKGLIASDARAYVFRTSWVYSPYGNNFLKTMLRLGADRPEVKVVADQFGYPTSALDIARAIWRLAPSLIEDQAGALVGIYHMTGNSKDDRPVSWFEFADEIFRQAELLDLVVKVTRTPIPSSEFPSRFKRPVDSRLDNAKLKDAFGLELPEWQHSVEEVLRRIAQEAGSNSKQT
jgi:dTDP-4-dehydrorhamnose reductase